MKTRITELFGIEYPVIQGGMAAPSPAHPPHMQKGLGYEAGILDLFLFVVPCG